MNEKKILFCKKCGYVWRYEGEAEVETSCPKCQSYVNLGKQRLDIPLPNGGDYGGAKFLGITEEGDALYWDKYYGIAVELRSPDYKKTLEDKESKELTPIQYVIEVSKIIGWKFLKPIHEIV